MMGCVSTRKNISSRRLGVASIQQHDRAREADARASHVSGRSVRGNSRSSFEPRKANASSEKLQRKLLISGGSSARFQATRSAAPAAASFGFL